MSNNNYKNVDDFKSKELKVGTWCKTDLSKYDNSWYRIGAGVVKRLVWYFANEWFLNCGWNVSSGLKVIMLRMFGAKIGRGVVIKPHVNIKYPWKLTIRDYVWIGEDVWIDNLDKVTIGNNCCLSQGCMLLSGNHDYKAETFDLIIKPITLEDGCWVGAKAIVTQGVTMHSHSVLTVGSVASKDLEEFTINSGNPAIKIRRRNFRSQKMYSYKK